MFLDTTTPGPITIGTEYIDYPSCANTGDDWYCQMYLPLRDQQTAGYPRFDYPGVVTGYYFASYIPDLELISYGSVTQILAAEGATAVTSFASVVVAAIVSLSFLSLIHI